MHNPNAYHDHILTKLGKPYVFKTNHLEQVLGHDNAVSPSYSQIDFIFADDKYIFAFGQLAQDYHEYSQINNNGRLTVWRFSKLTHTWTQLQTSGFRPYHLISYSFALLDLTTILVHGIQKHNPNEAENSFAGCLDLETLIWQPPKISLVNHQLEAFEVMLSTYQASVADKANNYLYISGGLVTGYSNLSHLLVQRYDLIARSWQLISETPEDRTGDITRFRHQMCLWEGKLYFFFGAYTTDEISKFEYAPTETMFLFNLKEKTWDFVDAQPFIDANGDPHFPCGRFDFGFFHQGDTVYIAGGHNKSRPVSERHLTDFWSFHLPTFTWTRMVVNCPKPVSVHLLTISEKGQMTVYGVTVTGRYNNFEKVKCDWYEGWIKAPSLKTMALAATVATVRQLITPKPIQLRRRIVRRIGKVQHVTPKLMEQYIGHHIAKNNENWHLNLKTLDMPAN